MSVGSALFFSGRGNKRARLTILGVAIGVYSVCTIAIIGMTGRQLLDTELGRMGFDCITISPTDKSLNQLNTESAQLVAQLPEVTLAAPLVTDFGQLSMRGMVANVVACGIDQSGQDIIHLELLHGRMFTKGETASASSVCVVDRALAESFYHRSNIVGKQLTLTIGDKSETFTVIGVVQDDQNILTNLAGDYIPAFLYLPYTRQIQMTQRSAVDQLFVQLTDGIDAETAGTNICGVLDRESGYRGLYRSSDLAMQKDRLSRIFDGITLVLMGIGGVSLVVSGLSIMTIMTSAVRERTKEIGIKKAIGARKRDILLEFLAEALWLTFRGGLWGTGASVATFLLLRVVVGLETRISMGLLVGVLLFSLLIGGIFGVVPARSAARLSPVEALRWDG
ncbi:ABC transporter permease [Angelakisella massiliensis]|uniref:ABC transporter permease n=1 Tax=Angelakisella massiliensis TaxID=1871018 RepID=UPI0024B11478|nr:ABC transporter permease [Angelakisella massiliensis]